MRREIEIIKAEKSSPPPLIEETTEQSRTDPSEWDVDGLRLWHFLCYFQLSCWSANRSATLPISSTNPFLSIKRDFQPTVNFNTKRHCRSLIEYLPGEAWIGLDKLHQLTSERSFSLHINMTDYDGRSYVAVYDRFEVI